MNTLPASSSAQANHSGHYVFFISLVATIGGFLFGYDLSIIGSANTFLRDQFHLSDAALGFATASGALGCMLGPFLGGWLCDRIGRERTMMIAATMLAAGSLLTAFAPTMVIFNIFRILGGVGVGLCSLASPMYINEVAPPRIRGRLGLMYQLAIVVGSTASPLVAYVILKIFPESVAWRWMFGSQIVFIMPFVVFLFWLPASPRWLAERSRFDEAADILRKVHGPEVAVTEMKEIKSALAEETGGFGELWLPGIRRALLIGCLLAFFGNWTGWSGIGGYIPIMLQMAGVRSQSSAVLQFGFTYLAMAIVTVFSMFLVDRVGRRPLWTFASILMAFITFATGFVFHYQIHGLVVLLVITLCTVPHGLALGGLPWLMMSELFPNRIRAKAVAVTTTFVWVAIFAIAQFFPVLSGWSERHLGSIAGAFWMFTFICICAFAFGIKMMPETRGRSLEEIAQSWPKGNQTKAFTQEPTAEEAG